MARQDLTLIYARTKSDAEIAIAQIRQKYNLPAYLMTGIIEGILSRLKDEAIIELSASADRYAEAVKQEAEEEKGETDVTFTNKSDS